MKSLSKSIKIHPSILKATQSLYMLKKEVSGSAPKTQQDLTPIFSEENFYKNGKGSNVLSKFNSLFGLHEKDDTKFSQLTNTSLHDSTLITCALEGKRLKNEINSIVECLKTKRSEFEGKGKFRMTRNINIDSKIEAFFDVYINALTPFCLQIDSLISSLEKDLPLASSISSLQVRSTDSSVDEKVFNSAKKAFGLSRNFSKNENRLEKITNFSSITKTANFSAELATVLMKFSNDIRFLSSGPRSGFGEITVPENEPGSSIMPGKVNPTQCESLTMVCAQVIGNTNAVVIANSSAMFEGAMFLPLIANNTVRSLVILSDGIRSFRMNCLVGVEFIPIKIMTEKDVMNKRI